MSPQFTDLRLPAFQVRPGDLFRDQDGVWHLCCDRCQIADDRIERDFEFLGLAGELHRDVVLQTSTDRAVVCTTETIMDVRVNDQTASMLWAFFGAMRQEDYRMATRYANGFYLCSGMPIESFLPKAYPPSNL